MSGSAYETSTELIVFTNPDIFTWQQFTLPYENITGIHLPDGNANQIVGNKLTDSQEQIINLPTVIAHRLAKVVQQIKDGVDMDCHTFTTALTEIPSYASAPFSMIHRLPGVETLPVGASGVITARGPVTVKVPHSVGYGLGEKSLQVLSGNGELGIANDSELIRFYSQLFEGDRITLHSYYS